MMNRNFIYELSRNLQYSKNDNLLHSIIKESIIKKSIIPRYLKINTEKDTYIMFLCFLNEGLISLLSDEKLIRDLNIPYHNF